VKCPADQLIINESSHAFVFYSEASLWIRALPGAVEIGGVSFSQLSLLPSTGHGRAGTTGKQQFEDTLK
jgi:hypothetical protein